MATLVDKIGYSTIWLAALFFAIVLIIANIFLGDLNQDEGWYLYAAKLVSEGKLLYRDFAFPQGPILPLFYSLFAPLIDKYGLLFGRLLNACIGLGSALLASFLTSQLVTQEKRKYAVLISFILVAVNVYQSYFFAVVKTYSLTSFFLLGSFCSLFYAIKNQNKWMALLSGLLITFAGATRSSAYIALPIVILVVLAFDWKERLMYILFFVVGVCIALVCVALPFLVLSYENFVFFVFKYHTLRKIDNVWLALAFKCGFISRLIQAYFVSIAIFLFGAVCRVFLSQNSFENNESDKNTRILAYLMWITICSITIVHFLAPFPYDDYQVFLYPLFVVAVVVFIMKLIKKEMLKSVTIATLLICVAASFSNPINQDWFIQGRDKIWWIPKDKPPILKLRDVARYIKSLSPEKGLLLTQDPYLAVETGKRLPHCLELGQFSIFPDMSNDEARRKNVLNTQLFSNLLQQSTAPIAALSGYAFAIKSPDITPLDENIRKAFEEIVSSKYELITVIQNFGQASTPLRIFKLKDLKKNSNHLDPSNTHNNGDTQK